MADTQRLLSTILGLLANNATGDISPQDVRDMVVSLFNGHGEISITVAAATAVAAQNTWYPVSGTWALSDEAVNWDNPSVGRLGYTGPAKRCCHIACTVSITSPSNNITYEWCIGLNGVPITPSILRQKIGTAGDTQSTAVHAFIDVDNGDYLELMVRNITDAADPTAVTGNLFVMDMLCDD